ncbi:hypothetical protein [Kitasatospora purpeofusca]|uniref:hypothetical protein n=1 Tax=Kitasatospora purpeofusca TaxID=67352 RepID=UPI0036D30214
MHAELALGEPAVVPDPDAEIPGIAEVLAVFDEPEQEPAVAVGQVGGPAVGHGLPGVEVDREPPVGRPAGRRGCRSRL